VSRPVPRRIPPEPNDRPGDRDWAPRDGTPPRSNYGYPEDQHGYEAPRRYAAPYADRGGYGQPPRHAGQERRPGYGDPRSGYGRRQDGEATALLNGRPYDTGSREPSLADWQHDGRGPGDYGPGDYGPGPGGPGGRGPDGRGPGGRGPGGRRPGEPGGTGRRRRKGRIRRLWRLRTVKVITGVFLIFFLWVSVSIGQALMAPNGGSLSSKLSEWARDHYLGPLVTFGEWLTYQPPKVGGKPSFSLATGENLKKLKFKKEHGFVPIIPKNLASPAGKPLPGEGVWRLVETVKNQPAMYTTFLRPDSVHTSYVAGLVSMDQRLLTFSLHPGSEDPGPGNWNSSYWIPPNERKGLMATFNGGFKLDVAGGGFYLNGQTKGSLTDGAASVVYYKDGTIKVGVWGRDVRMSPNVVGVRQNLKLIVDRGQIPTDVNENVLSSWGATLGGAYYVWRSGIGITKDGRVIYVYGPALNVETLAGLLQRAGAVEAMQLDINPFWTTFESYSAGNNPSDPTPHVLLPTQQTPATRYYSEWSRDFTAVYAR
jgi:hypothetical protein